MAARAKRTKSIEITTLKGLSKIRVSLGTKPLVAILGVNGAGKSTVLHALTCAFSPRDKTAVETNFHFPRFFPKSPYGMWNTTEFVVSNEIFQGKGSTIAALKFWKDVDRWQPEYSQRHERDVIYIGVDSAVPIIEREAGEGMETESEEDLTTNQELLIQKMKFIFNRNYSGIWEIFTKQKKTLFALQDETIKYDSFSMGAGEQRVLGLLSKVLSAPQHALILVDELDLLLHTHAFNNLVDVLFDFATREEKNLQIVFTTHREAIIKKNDKVEIRHIHPAPEHLAGTIYFEGATSDVIQRLTGSQPKDLEIFVEDDLAFYIVTKVAAELGLSRFVSISTYGCAENAFALAAGFVLSRRPTENLLIVLDGDEQASTTQRESAMNRVIKGSDKSASEKRKMALSIVEQFNLTAGFNPEQFVHHAIRKLPDPKNKALREVVATAKQLNAVANKHDFVDALTGRLSDKEIGPAMSRIIDVAAKTPEWKALTVNIRKWIESRAKSNKLSPL